MGKKNQRRATRRQENNTGCMWGLIRMFYSRQDPKFILDRKQGSRRHTFSGFTGRGHSRKKSRDFEEIDEDRDVSFPYQIRENMDECSTKKPTVRRHIEGEVGKVKQSKKIPNDEVQRILADLERDVYPDKSTMQNGKPKGVKNHNTSLTMASPSGSLDPSSSRSMKQAEEDDLELALSDFLGQIYRYHGEGADDDGRNSSELSPELKSLIHTKLNEFNNPSCDLAYEQTLVSEEKELVDNKYLSSRHVRTRLEPRKILEKTNIVEDTKTSNQCELAIKTQSKESRNIFFWKKDKSSRRHTLEESAQKVNKIVILKPDPRRGFDHAVATTSTCLQQQSCTIRPPGYNAAECSKFSIKEVKRRFRIVTGETRKGRPSVNEDGLSRDPCWLRDSVFTIKKDSRQVPQQSSAQRASANVNVRPLNSSKKKQINDGLGRINSNITASKDASIFYEVAKKHLTEILKDRSQTAKNPAVDISRSLVGMLSLPQCSTSSSPRSSPRIKDCIELSPVEKSICAIHKDEREESAKERSKSEEDSGSIAGGTSEARDEQADQERHFMKEEEKQHGTELGIVCIEEIDKPVCSETIGNAQCTPAEQRGYNSPLEMREGAEPGKEHVEMFPGSPENVVKNPEQQEPKPPRPGASLELISQIASKENCEKQEQTSPVSVLDPFFHDDVDSPDNESMIKCELRQEDSRPQYYADAGSGQRIFWEDKDVRLGYIKAVLELSELCTYQNLEVWYLEDELISPCLFEELHQGNQTYDLKLLFDCICEAITVIQGTYFRNPPCLSFLRHNIQAPPMRHNLISEINKHIEGHICYQFPSTLNQLVNMDLVDGTWMNLRSETEEIVVEIWEFILDELLEDITYDLWI